jgi:hypothetical protein
MFYLLGLEYEYKAVNLLKGEQNDPGASNVIIYSFFQVERERQVSDITIKCSD